VLKGNVKLQLTNCCEYRACAYLFYNEACTVVHCEKEKDKNTMIHTNDPK